MIGSKMVLTYKRKRLSSRPDLGFENECPDQSPGCQVVKTSVTEEEEESERKDPEILNPCPAYSGGSIIQDTGKSSSETNVIVSNPSSGCGCSLVSVSGQVNNESSLEAVDLKGKSGSSVKDNKPGFPLITFSRRSRHKKAVDVSGLQSVVEKDDLLVTNGSNTTIDNGGLADLSTDFTRNDPNSGYCTASQEKKTSEVVDLHSLPAPKIEINDRPTSEEQLITERCILSDTTPTPTPTPKPTSGILPMDAASHVSVKQPEESECHVSAVDESPTNKKRDGGSLASFDLSKPPPESSGLVECNLTLESSSNIEAENNLSETHRDSTDSSTCRSQSTVLHEFPSQGKVVLKLLDERIGETPLSQGPTPTPTPTPVPLSGSSHTWGPDLPSSASLPAPSISQSQTSKKSFLQLFPEDRVKDLPPLKKRLQEASFTSNGKHLHFRTSTPSTTPFGFDTPGGPHYPSDPVSLMRHKMMLDNIISKARIISGKKDNFDPPHSHTTWSEDELDFLWIGVRRHGIGNWDSMLRDPRLHFSYSRSPRELAERWEEEHSKLLITKTPPQSKRFRPAVSKKYEDPPQLSLGVKGNLPHWLWEAVSVPPSVAVSYTGHSGMMQWINQPFSGPLAPELRAPGGARLSDPVLDRGEVIGPHHCGSGSVRKADEVIVINSDASSEETISDDHRQC